MNTVKITFANNEYIRVPKEKLQNQPLQDEIKVNINATKEILQTYFKQWLKLASDYSNAELQYHEYFDSILVHADEAPELYNKLHSIIFSKEHYKSFSAFQEHIKNLDNSETLEMNLIEILLSLDYCQIMATDPLATDIIDLCQGKMATKSIWVKRAFVDFLPRFGNSSDTVNLDVDKERANFAQYPPLRILSKPAVNEEMKEVELMFLGKYVRNYNAHAKTKAMIPELSKEITNNWELVLLASALNDNLFLKYVKLPEIETLSLEYYNEMNEDFANACFEKYMEGVTQKALRECLKKGSDGFNCIFKSFLLVSLHERISKFLTCKPELAQVFWNKRKEQVITGLLVPSKKLNTFKKTVITFNDLDNYLKLEQTFFEIAEKKSDLQYLETSLHGKKTTGYYDRIQKYVTELGLKIPAAMQNNNLDKHKFVINKLKQHIQEITPKRKIN